MLKLHVLVDNQSDNNFIAEHGLSYLIECDNKKILFDTGQSPLFIKNANLLGFDLSLDIETIVISHGHFDHGGGLNYIMKKNLVIHPNAFIKRYRKKDKSEIGLTLPYEELNKKFHIIKSASPYKLTENLIYLGEVPRVNDFESKETDFITEDGKDDFVVDDSALIYTLGDELIVISGCSHAGICNIIEYAKHISGLTKIKAVIGGFHLKYYDKITKSTIEYLKKEDIERLYPAHCTRYDAIHYLSEEFEVSEMKTGISLEFC